MITTMRKLFFCLLAMMGMLPLSAQSQVGGPGSAQNVYDFNVKDDAGKDVSLSDYKGKMLLIVNTATRCGFTPQYKDLEALYQKYKGLGLEILDFPCNQFGQQAPGTIQEIHQFCTANYDIHFPQFDKIEVNGPNAHPLYTWLKAQGGGGDIRWNFTKFLIGRDGKVIKRYESRDQVAAIEADMQKDPLLQRSSWREVKSGDVTMLIAPQQGGKIMSFKYKDQELISQLTRPETFGSTFWTSPQKEWNWPPVPEYDKMPYEVDDTDGKLVMTSQVSARLGYRIRKAFVADPKSNDILVTYSILNETDETKSVAPWEITRVPNDGGLVFFKAPLSSVTPAGLMPFVEKYGAVWYTFDEANANRKINADGEGWMAYAYNGLLLLKQFKNLKPTEFAPGEAEIQVYVNRGKNYVELESQGAYSVIPPHGQIDWTVRWTVLPLTVKAEPSKALLRQVKKAIH